MARNKLISEVLRAAMLADDRTVTKIAEDAGVPQGVLSRFGRAERGITLKVADRLAVALGLELRPVRRK